MFSIAHCCNISEDKDTGSICFLCAEEGGKDGCLFNCYGR